MSTAVRKSGHGIFRRIVTTALFCLLVGIPTAARGGLYNPCEKDEGPFGMVWMDRQGRGFREILLKYRSIAMDQIEQDNPTRQRYVLMQKAFPNNADKALTLLQKLSFSEYLIRRGEADRAKVLLAALSGRADGNFLVSCNLAAACERSKNYLQAIDSMQDALKKWLPTWEELRKQDPAQLNLLKNLQWTEHSTYNRCREAEEYFLKLLKSRQREARKPQDTEIDALFYSGQEASKAVRYVDENGQFAPGKLAAAEHEKFPDKKIDRAIAIVQQLLVWMPWDKNLYRQLGELYSARGGAENIQAARMIFGDLVESMQSRNAEVMKRRHVLDDFPVPEPKQDDMPPALNDIVKKPEVATTTTPINWRDMAVIFGFGIIVGVVGQWQINEIRRRRQRMASRAS